MQQGPLAPRELPRFAATTDPAATLSPSAHFPVFPVIRPTLLQRFLPGTRRASPVAQHVLVAVLPLPPRRSEVAASVSLRHLMLPSPGRRGLGLRGLFSVGATCEFTFVAARRLAHHPSDGFVDRLQVIGFPPTCDPSYGALTLTPVGLAPTEHTSLCWTHSFPKTPSERTRRRSRSNAPWNSLPMDDVNDGFHPEARR